MKITILYDNEHYQNGLQADWGFSCLVQTDDHNILFDTGAEGSILLRNMQKLNIDPMCINSIFISHVHWDHIGGLQDILQINPVKILIPCACPQLWGRTKVMPIRTAQTIEKNIYSTGKLEDIEQSLIIKDEKGLILVMGCSHPGVQNILNVSSQYGKVRALIGGLHGFSDFELIQDLEYICPTHCTKYKEDIRLHYPEKYIQGGVGKVIGL